MLLMLRCRWVEALALGMNFVQERVELSRARVVILLYCLATPFGIIIGMILSAVLQGITAATVQAFLSCLAGGSFVYLGILQVRFCLHSSVWRRGAVFLCPIRVVGGGICRRQKGTCDTGTPAVAKSDLGRFTPSWSSTMQQAAGRGYVVVYQCGPVTKLTRRFACWLTGWLDVSRR